MNLVELASNTIAFTIQTTVIIGAALAVLALLRVSAPGVRYLFLRLLLGLCLLLPVVQPRVPLMATDDVSFVWLDTARAGFPLLWRAGGTPVKPVATAASSASTAKARWPSWILWAAIAGAGVRFVWIAAGLVRLRRLRRAGREAPATEDYDDLQARVGARPQIRFVPHLGQPITFGARRPVVLLPEMLRSQPPGIQRAVLAHELWHVRRRDWVWVLLEETVRAALWFHPAMWALISRIQAVREETVDELAILTTGSRRCYLDALVTFADRPCLFAAAAFARRRHLVHRILVISKESVMSSTRVVSCCAALAVVVTATSWYSVSAFPLTVTAQQAPRDRMPPPPPPPPMPSSKFAEMEARMLRQIQQQPNAVNYHALATLYFERASREPSLTPDQKSQVIAQGLAAADQALSYDAEFIEAMIYKNLLLRLQAQLIERSRRAGARDRRSRSASQSRGGAEEATAAGIGGSPWRRAWRRAASTPAASTSTPGRRA